MAPATPTPATRMASAAPNAHSDGFFSNLARKVGLGPADTTATAQPIPARPRVIEAKRNEPPPHPEGSILRASKPELKQATARPPLKPSVSDAPAAAAPAAKDSLVAGSAPIVSANSFESRFSAVK